MSGQGAHNDDHNDGGPYDNNRHNGNSDNADFSGFGSGDGYVSPFADDDYVSHGIDTSGSDDGTPNDPYAPYDPVNSNDRDHDHKPDNTSHTDTDRNGRAPLRITKMADDRTMRRNGTFFKKVIIMTVAIVLVLFARNLFKGNSNSSSTSSSSTSNEEIDTTKYTTLDRTGEITYYESAGSNGKTLSGKFAILEAQRGPADCNGQPTMLVTYRFTNLSKTNANAQNYLSYSVYHQGVGLQQIGCFADGDPDGYSMFDISSDVQPKASHEFKVAYQLPDQAVRSFQAANTGQDATAIEQDLTYDVRISNYARNLPTSIGATVTLPQDVNDLNPTDGAKPRTFEAPSATVDFKDGLRLFTGYSYTYDDSLSVHERIEAEAISARRGPNTYNGKHTVIVTYHWINHTKVPYTFNDAVRETVYQNGVELERTVFSEPTDSYSVTTRDAPVMPRVPMTTTMAYVLRDDTSALTATIEGPTSDEDTMSWDLKLE